MIIKRISDLSCPPIFYQLSEFLPGSEAYVKLEGLNIAGSVKLTTARNLIKSLENQGLMTPETKIVESSSGNLGVALSIICKEKGYPFVCVTDPNILSDNEKLMQIYGAKIIKITERDANGGYLSSRIAFIQQLVKKEPSYIWLNQYANTANSAAHYAQTAVDIHQEFPTLDYLFIGAGTTGTLMGCAIYFKEQSPQTKIIAVDTDGSVTFGFPAKKRYIPGIGTSRRPELVNEDYIDEILMVSEREAVTMCRSLLNRYGLFLGGSSGTVLQGVKMYERWIEPGSQVVAISPDFGHKYIDLVYNDEWVNKIFEDKHEANTSRT